MIPYIEILDEITLHRFALVEPVDCWFEQAYYEIGECEIYANATPSNLESLKANRIVKIPNKDDLWIITSVQYTFNAEGTKMISAKGKEGKYILFKRIIMTPTKLPNNLQSAISLLISKNITSPRDINRRINNLRVLYHTYTIIPIEETQAPRGNLWDFISGLLKTYDVGCKMILDSESDLYLLDLTKGIDVSDRIIFAPSLDNLLSSTYLYDNNGEKNFALVVSEIEDVDYLEEYDLGDSGIYRNEILVASNISTKYEDESGVKHETTPTSDLYKSWLIQEGRDTLSDNQAITEGSGEIDLENSTYRFGVDFKLGDLFQVKDEYFGYSFKAKVLKFTISQDKDGYKETINYEGQ